MESPSKAAKLIAQTAQKACLLEVCAPKPGNVNRQHDFADSRFEDFLLSALAIAPALEKAGTVGIGETIWRATRDTRRSVGTNTNLGIILLLAPLVKACLLDRLQPASEQQQRLDIARVRRVLSELLGNLTIEDAKKTYAAIRLAHPGGLGRSTQADVAQQPSITLHQAMFLAQDRDAVAREYVTDFAITFTTGYPALKNARESGASLSMAIVQAYLSILSKVPDTLIARKRDTLVATQVSEWAAHALDAGGVFTEAGRQALAALDQRLRDKDHSLNPGTTADLTTASLFLYMVEETDG